LEKEGLAMRYEYMTPVTIDETIGLLAEHNGNAKVIAGGTDLLLQIKNKTKKPEYLIDMSGIPGLDYIKYDKKQGLSIGALTTVRDVEKSTVLFQKYPVLCQAAGRLGSVAIRNVGTIGGNLCNASPSAENAPALIGLSAKIKIAAANDERVIPIEDFFIGPGQTVLKSDEVMTEIQVPPPQPNTVGVYLKHAIRGSIDLAIVGVAVIAELEGKFCRDIKIALGAVGPTPMRAQGSERIVKDTEIDNAVIEKCAQAASEESRPITDVRASAKYRKQMVEVLVRNAINEVVSKAL
jgi:carbon-monoxide dehydrogenase medium subunit